MKYELLYKLLSSSENMKVRSPRELIDLHRELEAQGREDEFKCQLNFDEITLLIMSLELLVKNPDILPTDKKLDLSKLEELKEWRKFLLSQN